MHTFSLFVRILLLVASYIGLCAALRVRFKLNYFIAPCTASCSIIIILMFGGMLGVLKYALFALYILGWFGLFFVYFFKKSTPPEISLADFSGIRYLSGIPLS